MGCGLSDKPDKKTYGFRLKDRIDDFEVLIDTLGLTKKITLVLHDWGGMIGMAYALKHPEKISRFVVLNTAAFLMPEGKKLPWQLWVVRNTPIGAVLVRGLNGFARGASWVGCRRRRLTRRLREAYCAPYDSWRDRIAVLRFVQDIPLAPDDPAFDTLTSIQASLYRFRNRPVLICWGARDFVFDDFFLGEWRRIYPNAEVHRFADAGHSVLEDATPEIVALIEGFLKRHAHARSSEGVTT